MLSSFCKMTFASPDGKVVVRRDGHVDDFIWVVNGRANFLVRSSVPE